MEQFTISLSENNKLLVAAVETGLEETRAGIILYSRYDSHAQKLVFQRDPALGDGQLALIFRGGADQRINPPLMFWLGAGDEFVLTDAVTAAELQTMQVVLLDGVEERRSNLINFVARESITGSAGPLEPYPDLFAKGFAAVDYQDGRLSFQNLKGETVDSVFVEGGSGSGYSPYIGENGNWYAYSPQAGDLVDTGVAARGQTGPAGPKGDTGPAGPKGEPTTVNGKTGTSITLSAADVGAAGEEQLAEVAAAAQAAMPASGGTFTGPVIAAGSYGGAAQVRNISFGTGEPGTLAPGEIYFQLEE